MQQELAHSLFYGANRLEKQQAIKSYLKKIPSSFLLVSYSIEDCLEKEETFSLLVEQFFTPNFENQKYIFHLKKLNAIKELEKKFSPPKNLNLSKLFAIKKNLWASVVSFIIKALQKTPKEHLILLESDSDKLLWDSFFLQILKKYTSLHPFIQEKRVFQLERWVALQFHLNNLNKADAVIRTLIELCDGDKEKIYQEIQKLTLLQIPLTSEIIIKMVEMSKVSIFVFLENVIIKNRPFFNKHFVSFFGEQTPQEMQKFFALLSKEFSRLLTIKWLEAENEFYKINQYLKLPQWLLQKSLKKAKYFTTEEVENIIQFLQKNDIPIKYAGKNANILLGQFCLQVVSSSFR